MAPEWSTAVGKWDTIAGKTTFLPDFSAFSRI
jgi:hypothetical protein